MANSIKTYLAVADAAYVYTTPEYLESADIKVYVDDVLQQASTYTLNNTALTFNSVLTEGQEIRIERQSDASSRLVDYTDGSLLNAETLDKDAKQIFNVAQEAYDQSRVTNMASGKFYYSQEQEPTDKVAGTLWYNKSLTPNVLQVWDGNGWYSVAPVKTTHTYTTAHSDFNTEAGIWDSVSIAKGVVNSSSDIFLNGVKLPPASTVGTLGVDGDYFHQEDVSPNEDKLWFINITADDTLVIETLSGGYADTVTGAVNQFNMDYAAVTAKIDDVDPKLDQVIAYDIPQAVSDVDADRLAASNWAMEAQLFAENPHNNAFSIGGSNDDRYSARHYSVEAANSAEQAARTAAGVNDPIEGWAEVDNETITTVSSNDPIIYSNGTLTLKADDRVIIEGDLTLPQNVSIGTDTNFPIVQGFIDQVNENWTGSSGVTLTKENAYKWKIEHAEMVGTDWIANVTINNAGNNSALPVAKVNKHSGHLKIEVWETNSGGGINSISDAEVYVEIFKFD